ncbi:pre-16S rRNA-processing nuclease YqgF [bacterium]|nr:pre-16S rRNA-processing nuclease YqgF [bacterium]
MIVLAVDPGSKKCGVAVVSDSDGILFGSVAELADLEDVCLSALAKWSIDNILVGSGTGSAGIVKLLRERLQRDVTVIDEAHSTERARMRFFADNPPKGWRRFVPLGLQLPSRPYDDYAAVVMAEDFIKAGGR